MEDWYDMASGYETACVRRREVEAIVRVIESAGGVVIAGEDSIVVVGEPPLTTLARHLFQHHDSAIVYLRDRSWVALSREGRQSCLRLEVKHTPRAPVGRCASAFRKLARGLRLFLFGF